MSGPRYERIENALRYTCTVCGYSTMCAPNDAREALAKACERAAAIAHMFAGPPEYRSEMTEQAFRDAEAVHAHAAALRAGRVTISPETTDA